MLDLDGFSVKKDAIDLRDRPYQPSLVPLRPSLLARSMVYARANLAFPRNQGAEGACVGFALAQLIDLENSLATKGRSRPVSARMLQEMGRQLQPGPPGEDGTTLRAAIKGFYHFGVCREHCWKFSEQPVTALTPERAKAARAMSLGAYYRLDASLNDYHAAIAETGAILVSAMIHQGWDQQHLVDGQIVPPTVPTDRGGHAFVVVGYNDKGFLVLNSWGPDWGGYRDTGGVPIKGVALWPYTDWADTIMDGWVLRLGVSASSAFDVSIGTQGLSPGFASATVGSIPAHRLIGHFAHLDDGKMVKTGPYASSENAVTETFSYLRQCRDSAKPAIDKYRAIMVIVVGSFFGIKDAVRHASELKNRIRPHAIYPYWVFWCNDFADQTAQVLSQFMKDAYAQIGSQGDALDALIETEVHGVGRAFWRDIARSASLGGQPKTGALALIFTALAALPDYRVHLVAEGAGALALAEVLDHPAMASSALLQQIDTLDMVLPTIGANRFTTSFAPLRAALDAKAIAPDGWRLGLHVAGPTAERNQSVGLYGRSILQLVERGFQPPDTPDAGLVGRWTLAQRTKASWNGGHTPSFAVKPIPITTTRGKRLSHGDLATAPDLWAAIIANAVARRASPPPSPHIDHAPSGQTTGGKNGHQQ